MYLCFQRSKVKVTYKECNTDDDISEFSTTTQSTSKNKKKVSPVISSTECSPLKMLLEINRALKEDAGDCESISPGGHSKECEDMNEEVTMVRLNLLLLYIVSIAKVNVCS